MKRRLRPVKKDTGRIIRHPEQPDIPARRRYVWLLPVVFVTYSLAYLDRANFGFGAAAGMSATLGISDKQVSLLSSLFFLGYFVFQLPGAALARTVDCQMMNMNGTSRSAASADSACAWPRPCLISQVWTP